MLTGTFHSIPVESITIDRASRQRREITNIDELKDSLSRIGQIHPIVVTREHVLIAGERRLTAIQALGWTHIAAQYSDELPLHDLRMIELEENIKRVDLTWQDQVAALEEYHELRKAADPTWSPQRTAESIGLARNTVAEKLQVAKAIKAKPELAKVDKFSVAKNTVVRENERAANSAIAKIKESVGVIPPSPIITADFHSWWPTYSGPKFNFLHCDLPYGINMQKSDQGAGDAHGTYEDTPDVYWGLIAGLGRALVHLLEPSAHLMFWLSMKYYSETVDVLTRQGWRVNPTPMVWHKSDNVGILADPQRGPRNVLEFCLIASRGDRKIVSAVANGISAPTERDVHMSVKPEPVLRHFFRMFVDEHTSMLDPTCGSGGAVRAAKALGASHYLGVERDAEFATRAREKFNGTN